MHICYLDESGTSEIPGTSSHFVLAGISIPIWHWKSCDRDVGAVLSRYGLDGKELHTAWLLRPYVEQKQIRDFEHMDWITRSAAVKVQRDRYLLKLQQSKRTKAYRLAKKTFAHTRHYTHLTLEQRKSVVREVASTISGWGHARLFAECVDKAYFNPMRTSRTIAEQAFEQVVSRFEQYLENVAGKGDLYGILVHDNNETVDRKHTELMREFHRRGTLWTAVSHIIETPLFVNSGLTSMVQVADLCAYALRRYLENNEKDLFDLVFPRADRKYGTTVGVRHFTQEDCACEVCQNHRARPLPATIVAY